jgi:flagellin-specific chaperone FliS
MNSLLSIQPIEGIIGILILLILIMVFSYISHKADKLHKEQEITTEITEIPMNEKITQTTENIYQDLGGLTYLLEQSTHQRKLLYIAQIRHMMKDIRELYNEYKPVPPEEPEYNQPGMPTIDRYLTEHWEPHL